jgi:hypothetical protein
MSLGALSPEAHEAIAIAMNTIGGRSTRVRAVKILHVMAPFVTRKSNRLHQVVLV